VGDNLIPRTIVVIPHRPVLYHRHRGYDNDRTHMDRSCRELLLQRKQVRWKKQTTRCRTTNDRRRLRARSSRLGALWAVASANTTNDQWWRPRGSGARGALLLAPPSPRPEAGRRRLAAPAQLGGGGWLGGGKRRRSAGEGTGAIAGGGPTGGKLNPRRRTSTLKVGEADRSDRGDGEPDAGKCQRSRPEEMETPPRPSPWLMGGRSRRPAGRRSRQPEEAGGRGRRGAGVRGCGGGGGRGRGGLAAAGVLLQEDDHGGRGPQQQ
jgi:hypothetical protein